MIKALPLSNLTGSAFYGQAQQASEVTQWQIDLARRVVPSDICAALVAEILGRDEPCSSKAEFETTNTNFVGVQDGGAVLPVFLIEIAAKSPVLSNYHSGAFEAHRYYAVFALDLDLQMQVMIFDYEPLFNTASSLADVRDRNQPNTEYIPVTHNDKISDLTTRVRIAIINKLVALGSQEASQ
jgi:hypothetical protein